MLHRISYLALSLSLFISVTSAELASAEVPYKHSPLYDNGSIIVVYKKNSTLKERYFAARLVNYSLKAGSYTEDDKSTVQLDDGVVQKLTLPGGTDVKQAIKEITKSAAVAYAEPNYFVTAAKTPNDPDYEKLWGLNNKAEKYGKANADIDAPEAWDSTTGNTAVVVGVIDTGVDYNHPDLKQNIWTNEDEIPGNNIDDDDDGYVDDVHGINTVAGTGDPMDYNSHGTHVAGTIGAKGNNGIGVVGVNWNVRIIGCNALGSAGRGGIFAVIQCLNYMIGLKVKHSVNIVAINDSWTTPGYSRVLKNAIEEAGKAGILSVAAAGNDERDIDRQPTYPASFDSDCVISVAATDRNDNLWFSLFNGSNYGLTGVDLAAPGSNILSTVLSNGYGYKSGTSMAAPHVTGASAIAWSWNPEVSVAEMKGLLMNTGDRLTNLKGKTVSGKRLNVNRLLASIPGYSFKASPDYQQITAGKPASYSFDVRSIAGWQGDIALNVTTEPELCCLNLSKPTASVNDSANDTFSLNVDTGEMADWGIYHLTVSGESEYLKRSSEVTLSLLPEGIREFPFNNTIPIVIPGKSEPVSSVIGVKGDIQVVGLTGYVSINNKMKGELSVTLTSPQGTKAVIPNSKLTNEDGNQIYSFSLADFNREIADGEWKLTISQGGTTAGDDTRLNAWGITILGIGDAEPTAPVAKFNYEADKLKLRLINASYDLNDDIVSYLWDFGDGITSVNANETHTFAKPGIYTIILKVEDSLGKQSTAVSSVEVFDHDIKAKIVNSSISKKRKAKIKLKWKGARGEQVAIYRDNELLNTVENSGNFRQVIPDAYDFYFYKVCETISNLCSAPMKVTFSG